jgi:hypothetical protein
MSLKKFLGLGLGCAMILSGCGTTHFVKFPDSSTNKGKRVTASLSHGNILGLTPPKDLDKLVRDLSEQCGNGRVEGISMTDSRSIFLFLETIKIEAAGTCAE